MMMYKRYWLALLGLVLLSPLGLLAEGTAWGEWEAEELSETFGFIPQGMEQMGSLWQAFFPDYSMRFLGDSAMSNQIAYILSALIGSALIYGVMTGVSHLILSRKSKRVHFG